MRVEGLAPPPVPPCSPSYMLYIYICVYRYRFYIHTLSYIFIIVIINMYLYIYVSIHTYIRRGEEYQTHGRHWRGHLRPSNSHLSVYLSVFLCIHLSTYLSIDLSTYPFVHLSIYLSIYLAREGGGEVPDTWTASPDFEEPCSSARASAISFLYSLPLHLTGKFHWGVKLHV